MQISLGTGLASGQRRRGPWPPVPGAPILLRPPRLAGTGRIGSPLAADPGDWTGAQRFDFAWLRDGAEVAGATGAAYVPAAADDRTALACRITAVGAAGRRVAETPAIAAVFPHPLPVGAMPDLVFTQGTGPRIMDASPFFSGSALSFSVSGDGVAIDPATGLATIRADALLSGAAILVVAENSGGRAELRFSLKVTPAVAPILITGPTLAGAGRVGAELVADPGVWAGEPAPELALQWLCDGAPVAGATGARFTPGDAEDGAAVAVEVTARNAAGTLAARSAARGITRAAPVATGGLGDVVLALGGDAGVVPAAGAFAGAALRFAVIGAGAAIDPATGVVTLPTGARRAAETVTVTATNSGGSASVAFAVRVLAAPAASGAPEAAVFARGAGSQTVALAGFFAGDALVFALDAGPAGVEVDPATGLVTVPTGTALDGAVVVRASNAVGAATLEFAVRVLAAPAASGAPAAAVFDVGSAATVAVAGFFAGDALVFALDAGPAGVEVDPATGLVTVPTGAALDGAVVVRASNAVGAATLEFAVRVLATGTAAVTVFDAPEKLAEVSFVRRNAVPSWSYDAAAGWAVFSPGNPGDFTHGAWARARGDGRYRALVRINHSAAVLTAYTRSRPFGLNGRMARAGADMRGVRVELDRRVDGTTAFEIREYAGRAEEMTLIGGAPVAWAYDVWYWMETEFDGPTVRARLYPATEAAPAWQATATTTSLGAGFFGPMSHAFAAATYPILQIRRLEYHPLAATGPAPRLTGTISAVRASVGAAIRVDAGAVVEGAGLSWSAAVDGAALPAGWAISPEGVLTAPTGAAFASRSVAVTATDAFGRSVTATFAVAVDPAAPRLTGAPSDVTATVGDLVRVDFGAIVTGTGLAFTVDRPWTIDAGGVLSVPTAALLNGVAVTVTATDGLGRAVSATFRVTVRAPALVLTAPVGNVTATIGQARTVDVGALVTPKTGLTWTTSRPTWALSAAGVLTIPTTAVLAAAAVAVTATDAFGQSVTATFQVAVAAAPMTLTAAPSFAAAAAPGTALGSVWNIAGGAYAGGAAPFTVERRFLRDGQAIGAYGAATAYTIVAADQGKTITAQVRRTDASVPPQVLTVEVAGAAVIPAAVPPMTLTAAPSFAAAAAPGTALGSVWNIAGGAYAGGAAPFVTERRFLRDGQPIGAYGAATAHAIVAADQGKTVTAQVRRTDSSVPPQVLTVDAAGAAVIPAAVPPMTLTAAPSFAAAAAPGTALGSVWNIAGGAYAGGAAPFVTERRFLRDGAPIGAYGAATAHAIVAADQGKTVTAQLRRTDSSVPPQVLTVDAAGAAVIPAAPIPGLTPDFTVSTTAQLLNAMITAAGQAGPKVIACNPGRYLGGITRLNSLVKVGRAADGTNLNNRVTIISADRRTPATFIDKGFEMSFADGFTFDGLTFQNTREDAQGWPASDNAFQMKDCANITVRNCTFSDWQDACNCTRGRNYTYEWNRWQRQGKDSCRFFDRNVNVLVQNNTFTNPRVDPARAQEGPRHPDFLSLQLAAPEQRGNVGVTIRRNFFSGHNHYHQGIFMPNDEALTTGNFELYKHVGVTITENWLIMAHVNTLLVAGAEDVLVNRNVVRTFGPGYGKPGIWDPGTKVQPKVTFGQVVKGVCRDNVGPWAVGVTNLDAAKSDLARINNIADPSETVTPPGMAAPYPNGPYAYE